MGVITRPAAYLCLTIGHAGGALDHHGGPPAAFYDGIGETLCFPVTILLAGAIEEVSEFGKTGPAEEKKGQRA